MVSVGAWQKWAANPGGRPSREVRYVGNMCQKDIPLLFPSIDADNHLPPGSNLITSCACKDDVSRSRVRCLAPVEICRVADMDVRTRVYYPSVKQSITFWCCNLGHVERSVCVTVSTQAVIINLISMRSAIGCYGSRSIGSMLGLCRSLALCCIECPSDVVVLVELLHLLQELRILERVLNHTNSRLAWSVTLRTAFCLWV
jgi:hypothetical protein